MRIIAALLTLLMILNSACTSTRQIHPSEIKGPQDRIYAATYQDGRTIEFAKVSPPRPVDATIHRRLKNNAVYGQLVPEARHVAGLTTGGERVAVSVDSLQTVQVHRFSVKKAVLYGLLGFVSFWSLLLVVEYAGN